MRVTQNPDGSRHIEDEPIRIDGEAARRVREEIERMDRSGLSEKQRQFKDECERVFRSSNKLPDGR